jgi:hypothetical protein
MLPVKQNFVQDYAKNQTFTRCVEWVVVVDTLMKNSSKLRFHYVCFNPERYYINYTIFDIQILPVLSGLSILDLALGFPNVYLHYNYIVV